MIATTASAPFFGWRVVAATFVLAIFGWGLGFYGPPVYLHAVRETRGWPVPLVSAAVTTHFLIGAVVVANLPRLYRRHGLPRVTKAGAVALAAGLLGWALAREPWQLFAATAFSGAGWVAMGAVAVNAIVSPWFIKTRPKALSTAYNGASIGGVIFSPLWSLAIAALGFPLAATLIGLIMVVTIWVLTDRIFARTPAGMGQSPDGAGADLTAAPAAIPTAGPLPGNLLWHDWRFRTLAGGVALGLFAQIGLIAHLFSLMVPALGAQAAGLAMALATAAAIAGRTTFGWLMPPEADRRLVGCLSYAIQIAGAVVLVAAGGDDVILILVGVILFGFGIGNATSLPPLIAQVEFAQGDTSRVVALIVAIYQGTGAFAPAMFGILREMPGMMPSVTMSGGALVFAGAGIVQLAAVACFLAGRRPAPSL